MKSKPVRFRGQTLSTIQIMALRTLVEKDEENYEHIAANTRRSLQRKKLLDAKGEPTIEGVTWVDGYVTGTGDGPELLKEHFRF